MLDAGGQIVITARPCERTGHLKHCCQKRTQDCVKRRRLPARYQSHSLTRHRACNVTHSSGYWSHTRLVHARPWQVKIGELALGSERGRRKPNSSCLSVCLSVCLASGYYSPFVFRREGGIPGSGGRPPKAPSRVSVCECQPTSGTRTQTASPSRSKPTLRSTTVHSSRRHGVTGNTLKLGSKSHG
jgi:hypothetical protein